jgi:V/A-type H+-transporting ATPase subunit I
VELPDPGAKAFAEALDRHEAALRALEERRSALLEERDGTLRLVRLLAALAPLRAETPPPRRAHAFGLALRRDRGDALPLLEAEVARLTRGAGVVRAREAGEGELAVLLVVPESCAASVAGLLFEHGVEEVRLPARYGDASPARALVLLGERAHAIPGELAALERERAELAARLASALAASLADLEGRLGRLDAAARCGETHHAFVVWGWVPAARVPALRVAVERELPGVAVLDHPVERGDEADAPVLLANPPALRAFELLLGLVPLPRYGSVDPTPYLAVFFPLFFGVMVGDSALGAAGLAAAAVARWRGWGGRTGRDVATVGAACAAAVTVFGVLFGEALGDLGRYLGMRPLLLDRGRALVAFLALALALGLGQLLVGLALGTFEAVRRRARREAVARVGRAGVLASAAVVAGGFAGALPPQAVAAGLAAALACAGAAVVAEGPMALLEAVLSLGNVLSYARLMALGLASVMLAEVANEMARAFPGAGGVALGAFLHAVNFTIGLVSPAIAALRLQYVEFFEKFYREGGRPFRPFAFAGG